MDGAVELAAGTYQCPRGPDPRPRPQELDSVTQQEETVTGVLSPPMSGARKCLSITCPQRKHAYSRAQCHTRERSASPTSLVAWQGPSRGKEGRCSSVMEGHGAG